jgi:tight adherence protein C
MDALQQAITQTLGPLGPVVLAGVLGMMMVVLVVIMMMRQPEDPLDKLKRDRSEAASGKMKKKTLRQGARNEQLQRFANFLEPQDVAELSKRQLTLRQAGYQSRDAVRMFHAAQFILGVLGLIGGVIYTNFILGTDGMSTQKIIMWTVGPGGAGYYLPQYWVTRRVEERKEQITRGFPDALDMMLVCVEAGQSLDQSINRVAGELRASYPALSDEFQSERSERYGQTLWCTGCVKFCDGSGAIRHLRDIHCGCAARLCRRNARQTRDAGRRGR